MYYVYVLRSVVSDSHYTGITDNIERRLNDHNSGKNYSTQSKRPWKLIYVEIVDNREDAQKFEIYLKSGYGREVIREIEDSFNR